ncbi:hypothetical protein [Roseibium salinum]|uniref:Uncharacterized protein n=1 Tax=Roseibium salinum TaxID=1604349 RepID=A0ABT3QX65_9HYPH|nr:hypothetical protein [Roseibium sp. DSM 29163]MCX2721433.1 hypothetical protein [Roseibium sp. DSM 29163]
MTTLALSGNADIFHSFSIIGSKVPTSRFHLRSHSGSGPADPTSVTCRSFREAGRVFLIGPVFQVPEKLLDSLRLPVRLHRIQVSWAAVLRQIIGGNSLIASWRHYRHDTAKQIIAAGSGNQKASRVFEDAGGLSGGPAPPHSLSLHHGFRRHECRCITQRAHTAPAG